MLKFLKRGIFFVKENPKILYSLLLIILIPLALFYNTFFSVKNFQKNIDFTLQANALLAESILGSFISEFILNQEILQEKIIQISKENPEIKKLRVAIPEEKKFKIIASQNSKEIGRELKGRAVRLAWDENQVYAFKSAQDNERFWEVVKPIENSQGQKIAIVGMAISLKRADTLMKNTIFYSYLIALIAIIFTLFLIIHHTRLFSYVALSKKLQEIDKMKDDFIRMAIHELQGPIGNIRNYALVLKEEADWLLEKEQKTYLSRIVASSQRLNELISDMLVVSRIEQGRIELKPQKVYPPKIIKEIIEELKFKAQEKQLNLIFQEKEEPYFIKVNPHRLKEIIYNLIDNAIKYTFEGEVKIQTQVDEKRKRYYIIIQDTGLGMSAENQKHLFEKFYRIKSRETADIPGTGLGLWITKQLVEKMGGEILVESIEKIGSKFTIIFPLFKEEKENEKK